MQMLDEANMSRGAQIGVPVAPTAPGLGLRWKTIGELTDADYERIEQYFLLQKTAAA